MIPQDLRFLETHEWARREPDGQTVTMGLSAYAIAQLGDIVFLELPRLGAKVEQGKPLASVESVKAASDIYAPVTGEVTQINQQIPEQLDIFKQDPYGQGWLARIKMSDPAQWEKLLDSQRYQELIRE